MSIIQPIRITAPGFHDGIPAEMYHGDCCDTPSLSASGAHKLSSDSAARFWYDSYLNPAYVREQKKAFDIGHAGHLMMLEPEKFAGKITVVDADDWKTKAAQGARDDAYAADKIPLLPKDVAMVEAMRRALFAHPMAGELFASKGVAERSLFWRDRQTGIWLKCRPDFMPAHRRIIVDYKTAVSANPDDLPRVISELGYHQQAAWYMDGYEAVFGNAPEKFWFVVQEKKAPYLVTIFALDEAALDVGRDRNREAIDLFARCLSRNEWPGYRNPATPDRDTAFMLNITQWAHIQHQDRLDRAARAAVSRLPPRKPSIAEMSAQYTRAIDAQRPLGDA